MWYFCYKIKTNESIENNIMQIEKKPGSEINSKDKELDSLHQKYSYE